MQAEQFFVMGQTHAVPIYLITDEQWAQLSTEFSAKVRNQVSLQEFTCKNNELCIIQNEDGLIDKIYIGFAPTTNPAQIIAMAALTLPAGIYQYQGELTESVALFWALAQYKFERYKTHAHKPRQLLVPEDLYKSLLNSTTAHFLVRDLINTPAADMGPEQLAQTMSQMAQNFNAEFKEWVGDDLLDNNFPAIHAVGRAAAQVPRLLSLSWGVPGHPKIALVGKGVCFDSGGLDIKSAYGMRIMKKDMGGAAHALGLAMWIMQQNLPVCLQVLVPAVENAIGPNSFRPGDILTMRNGLTVEIHNTDAEGRLILADALSLADEQNPDLIIDFATLTGAARTSVGTEISALFTNDDEIAHAIIAAGHETSDPIWRLPLYQPYDEYLKSNVADMANCSDHPYAGAIIASLFLKRFLRPDVSWVHFDIMAWSERNKPGKPEGGEAMGLRAMMHFLLSRYQ
ncbi:MAG: leucyl aminopeptidase [Legionella sp. 40-6]|nr:MAG: leucyl aminopeptidase [Legionella sp. 40-6]